jgi:hypothetical protein
MNGSDNRMTNVKPNALKHGLTATIYVSPDQAERYRAIQEELIRIHSPESAEEMKLVDRLAIAHARLYDAEAAWDDRFRWQRTHAIELFDRFHRERFEKDLVALWSTPFSMAIHFGQTWHSAQWLKSIWGGILDGVSTGCGITYDQAKTLVTIMGGDWRSDRVDVAHGQLMGLFLVTTNNAEAAIVQWVTESRAGRIHLATLDDDLVRARWIQAFAPARAEALERLKELAKVEFVRWTEETDRLRIVYEKERALRSEAITGEFLGNADDIRSTRLIERYRAQARNEASRIERRLQALCKFRVFQDMLRPKPASDGNSNRTADQIAKADATTEYAMRACSTNDRLESLQGIELQKLTSKMRNEILPGDRAASHRQKPVRRPDPLKVAKQWRGQAKSENCARGRRVVQDKSVSDGSYVIF